MPRKVFFTFLQSCLLVGLGFWLGRLTGGEIPDPEVENDVLPALRVEDEPRDTAPPAQPAPSSSLPEEDPSGESPAAAPGRDSHRGPPTLFPLTALGADGDPLREALGVPVRSGGTDEVAWLVPRALIEGAVGLEEETGAPLPGAKVSARSRSLAMALVAPARGAAAELSPTAPPLPIPVRVRGEREGGGVPTHWVRTGFDATLDVAVGVLEARGCGPRGGAVFDGEGRLLGLVPPAGVAGDGRYFLPLIAADLERFERIDMTLARYKQLFFDGTAAGHLARARRLKAAGRFGEALGAYREALARDGGMAESLGEEMRECHWGRLEGAPLARAARRRALWLDEALGDFPDDGDFHWERMRAARALGDFPRAISEALEARRSDPVGRGEIHDVLAELHLAWARELARSGKIRPALDVVDAARSRGVLGGELARLEGDLLLRLRDYGGAIAAYEEAIRLDASLAEILWPEIRRAERFTAGPGRMLIDYPPGARSVVVQVTVDGVRGDFILDTGATSTMVPVGLARSAGLDLSNRVPKVRVKTAGNERVLPFTPTRTLRLGSLEVSGLSVVVGDLPGLGQKGLLGMDFLSKFRMENDPEHGRMVLSTR